MKLCPDYQQTHVALVLSGSREVYIYTSVMKLCPDYQQTHVALVLSGRREVYIYTSVMRLCPDYQQTHVALVLSGCREVYIYTSVMRLCPDYQQTHVALVLSGCREVYIYTSVMRLCPDYQQTVPRDTQHHHNTTQVTMHINVKQTLRTQRSNNIIIGIKRFLFVSLFKYKSTTHVLTQIKGEGGGNPFPWEIQVAYSKSPK